VSRGTRNVIKNIVGHLSHFMGARGKQALAPCQLQLHRRGLIE
jgi:hypothetical protein